MTDLLVRQGGRWEVLKNGGDPSNVRMILKYRTDTPLWTMHQIGLSQLPKQTYKLTCHFYPNFGQSLGNSDNKDLL